MQSVNKNEKYAFSYPFMHLHKPSQMKFHTCDCTSAFLYTHFMPFFKKKRFISTFLKISCIFKYIFMHKNNDKIEKTKTKQTKKFQK